MGSLKQDAKYIPKHAGQTLYRGGKAIVGGIKAGLTGGKTPKLGQTDYEKVLQGRMEKSNVEKYGTKNPKVKGEVRRLQAVSIPRRVEVGKVKGDVKEGHYGSAVNKIPAELDKAVALHKSQAERLRTVSYTHLRAHET